jgi:uncharacterized protein YdbL (DUF1318 family)
MRRFVPLNFALACFLIAACVTINVYFPAAAAEKAADKLINDVLGEQTQKAPADNGDKGTSMRFDLDPVRLVAATGSALLDFIVPPANAQGADFDISTPEIRAITDSMKARNGQLEKYYTSGAIGFTADGMIDVRDQNLIPLPERNAARKLVADENKDRGQLYAEIAKANGHPEWESDIRNTFGSRWQARAQSSGWYFKDAGGNWKK